VIPSDFKADLDRICALFAQVERELNDLVIKADFSWKWRETAPYYMSFERLKGRFRIWYGDRPINDLSAVEKIEVAEHIHEFKDAYVEYLTDLANRAKKAGKQDA
jgi:hypothetical protein